jgi:hypothetical protein
VYFAHKSDILPIFTRWQSKQGPPLSGFFYARKTVQDVKRAGGCEYWSFSLLAFSTRVIGMSR